jgi:hypothetical protein
MQKSADILLLGAVIAGILHTGTVMADIIAPIGLAAGSEYQLIFVTYGTTNAESNDISTYNAFVSAQAALNPLLPAATWDAVASTATVEALTNAPNATIGGGYVPVYNTQGIEVSGSEGLYTPSGESPLNGIFYDQYGSAPPSVSPSNYVWTGSKYGGVFGTAGGAHGIFTEATLGGPNNPITGDDGAAYVGNWMTWDDSQSTSALLPMYALSSVLTVPSPEPATVSLLGSALALLAGHRLFGRRRRARRIG